MRPINIKLQLLLASLLMVFTLNACYITRVLDERGIKYLSPTDLKRASVNENTTLFLEAKTVVSWSKSAVGQSSSDTIKMECDLTTHLDAKIDISGEVKQRTYRNAPGELDNYFKSIKGLEHVFYVKSTECTVMDDDATLLGEKVEIVTDHRKFSQNNILRQFLIYVHGDHKSYPTRNYLIAKVNKDVTVFRFYLVSTQRRETFARYVQYIIDPLTGDREFVGVRIGPTVK